MSFISKISSSSLAWESIQNIQEQIQLRIDLDPCEPEEIVKELALTEGPIDIYCWYEGSQCIPLVGANFMKTSLLQPLYESKKDAKFYLYSLKAWNFEPKKNISDMKADSPLGEAINRLNKAAIECIYSSSFFKYCTTQAQENCGLYEFFNEELPKKKWLLELSENKRRINKTIEKLFNEKSSLLDSIKEKDISEGYSLMQYVEGYYLIQESVKKGLVNGQKKIQIAFVLPNDEGKYYLDYPKDIEPMLRKDFGEQLSGIDIAISFKFFKYNEIDDRPYINKNKKPTMKPGYVNEFFNYLTNPAIINIGGAV